jgi:hypothetical protein
MGLLDDLRQAAPAVDQQFVPGSNDTPGVLAALIVYTEHGDKFLKAAQDDDDPRGKVTELIAGAETASGKTTAAEKK